MEDGTRLASPYTGLWPQVLAHTFYIPVRGLSLLDIARSVRRCCKERHGGYEGHRRRVEPWKLILTFCKIIGQQVALRTLERDVQESVGPRAKSQAVQVLLESPGLDHLLYMNCWTRCLEENYERSQCIQRTRVGSNDVRERKDRCILQYVVERYAQGQIAGRSDRHPTTWTCKRIVSIRSYCIS